MNEEKNTDKNADLADLMQESYTTRRATVPALEEILYKSLQKQEWLL